MAGDSPPKPNPKPKTSQGTKRKRSLPGNPDPEAEVIALSPATLLAAATYVCEVCGKEFRRDQNLQIHRRGHNIPWKFSSKQPPRAAAGDCGSSKEATKPVYVCPVEGCVYHEPSRALGDLTGIKKHYSRKHGEKKWECERCLKKYAVKTDWKAHDRVCGSRAYECACGTLFSMKESFDIHRASCQATAGETTDRSDGAGGELATGAAMAMTVFGANNTELLFPSLWGQASGGGEGKEE